MIKAIAAIQARLDNAHYATEKIVWNESEKAGVVLVKRFQTHEPFVTWCFDANGMTFSGHYFDYLDDASLDFKKRAERVI